MAEENKSYHCGCGLSTKSQLDACEHVNKAKHEMEIRGNLLPDGVKKGVVKYNAKEDIFDGLISS